MKGFRILGSVVLFLAILGLFLWTSSGVKAGDEIKAGEEVKAAEGVKAAEAAFTYIGSEKCKMCHKGETKGAIFEKWLETPHAKAFENLPAASQKDEKCLVCHTTAFGAGGYVVGAEGAEAFAGVGCEACHGPGSEYKSMKIMKDRALALKAGMIVPTAKECAACHTAEIPKACWGGAEAAPKFDFAVASKAIAHSIPK